MINTKNKALLVIFTLIFSIFTFFAFSIKASAAPILVDSMFESDNAIITTGINTPGYVTKTQNGVLVKSGEEGAVYYNTVLDLSNNTKDNLLAEVQITPEMAGTLEFSQLVMRLTDTENAKNYVEIAFSAYPWNDSGKGRLTYVTVITNTITQNKSISYSVSDGNVKTGVLNGATQGSMVYSSFVGSLSGESRSIRIYYDNQEKAIYSINPSTWPTGILTEQGYADADGKFLILDLDNPAHMGTSKSNLWNGFTNGTAKVSFTAKQLTASQASYMILSINGQSLDGAFLNDVEPPELTISADLDNIPNAVVGKNYNFFSAQAVDKMYGKIDNVITKVYYDNALLETSTNSFVPTIAGDYFLVYSASDGNGNTAYKSIKVTAVSVVPEIVAEIEQSSVLQGALDLTDTSQFVDGFYPLKLYKKISLPKFNVFGGVGSITTQTTVYYNGSIVNLNDNSFAPEQTGVYVVEYVHTDYVGNTLKQSFSLISRYVDMPELFAPVLPENLLDGYAYLFPRVSSQYYSSYNTMLATNSKITIYSIDGVTKIKEFDGATDIKYIADISKGNKIIVEYSVSSLNGEKTAFYRKTINLLADTSLISRFTADGDSQVIADEIEVNLKFDKNGDVISYVNPVLIEGLQLQFNIDSDKNNFSRLDIYVTDSLNPASAFIINIYKNPNSNATVSFISVNAKEQNVLPGSFYGNTITDFILYLNSKGEIFNNNNDLCAVATNNISGGAFDGFTSGKVYLAFAIDGKTADSEIILKQIRNQILGDIDKDFINPSISISSDPASSIDLGKELALPSALAGDVYSPQTQILITLVSPDEKTVFSFSDEFGKFNGETVILNQYGVYKLTYTAVDAAGNRSIKRYSIEVADTIAPVLTINGTMPQSSKINAKIKLPSVYAVDDNSPNPKITVFCISPNGVLSIIDGKNFVPTEIGEYKIVFYAEDDNYNYAMSDWFSINITK